MLQATDSRISPNAVTEAPAAPSRAGVATAVDVSVLLAQPEGSLSSSFCFPEHDGAQNLQQEDLQLQVEGLHEHHLNRRRASNRQRAAISADSAASLQEALGAGPQQQPQIPQHQPGGSGWRHATAPSSAAAEAWLRGAVQAPAHLPVDAPEQHGDAQALLYRSIQGCSSWTSLRHITQLHGTDMAPACVE